MRIRPFFWLLLIVACMSVLSLARLTPTHIPVVLQIHIDQPRPLSVDMTLLLFLTDPQGVSIDEAQIVSSAAMTNMEMASEAPVIKTMGDGHYQVIYHFSMPGPWAIHIQTYADGFLPLHETLLMTLLA
jgi:hypothetical protein